MAGDAGEWASLIMRTADQYVRDVEVIRELLDTKTTLRHVARKYGLSHESVRQITIRHGADVGLRVKKNVERIVKKGWKEIQTNERYIAKIGMPKDEYTKLIKMCVAIGLKNPRRVYDRQRQNASDRGIPWELSFAEWWKIWEPYYFDRGRGRDRYCMARLGDVGPYSLRNVEIKTNSENSSEMHKNKLAKNMDVC